MLAIFEKKGLAGDISNVVGVQLPSPALIPSQSQPEKTPNLRASAILSA
jgi:hypothetical protein